MKNNIKIPKHIAIIMDGNGRWSKERSLQKRIGHGQGILTAEKIVKLCQEIGVEYVTLYAFSLENWFREESEVKDLMDLLRQYISTSATDLVKKNVRFIFIGNRKLLPVDIQQEMQKIEEKSSHHQFTLIMAISYGSRYEIESAASEMAIYMVKNNIQEIHETLFEKFINPFNIPDPDLLIRTGGEVRLSNFLLWQLAYSELYFSKKFWPDFTESDMLEAIDNFNMRERRYGK